MTTLVESSQKKYWKNDKILLIMQETGLNALQLAEAVGISRSTLSHILAHRNKPSFEVLSKINDWNPKYSFDWFSKETPEELEKITQLTENQKYGHPKGRNESVLGLNEKVSTAKSPATNEPRGPQIRTERPEMKAVVQAESSKQRKAVMITIYYDDNTHQIISLDPKLNNLLGNLSNLTNIESLKATAP
ncbi:MAG: helix-turn-helix domain-containing protein [Spirosomaceae bacterium]|nr:helix-turn-helix domain-containing protein [Spirosomataceae bacterium]